MLEDDRESLLRRLHTAEENLRDTQRTETALRDLIRQLKMQLKDVQREIVTQRAIRPATDADPLPGAGADDGKHSR
ncbi:MAG: hypothetical protein LKF98_00945 [Microbacteriaceae bacterium]|nr:hypothetical protein [Microbacteriaceae bacterium]